MSGAASRLDALAAAWPLLVEHYPRPFPVEVCRLDLAMMLNDTTRPLDPVPLPGRPELARRWGVTDWQVRTLLRELGDETLIKLGRKIPPALRQRSASAPPADRQSEHEATPTTEQEPPGLRQGSASAPPADRHARVSARLLGCSALGESESTAGAIPSEVKRDTSEDLAALVALQEQDEPQHGLHDARDTRALDRELRAGRTRADLALLWRWSGEASDADAEAARRNGWRRWRSLLNSSASSAARLDAARRWEAGGCPAGPPPRAAPARDGRRRAETVDEWMEGFGVGRTTIDVEVA